ncbi:helix-turn-helix transcriptional regulator [Apilactobacillus ozensis]|uniref:HTH cro/C1-type domain-containing protein n=1 Tax=Apilactobacillus ozensis DSM 23829 = JCM 17196 TaxID=1423781 RepID=A0A0R2AK50_9LACO|nr:helix-turn-helix transcriptional regulator [Apilactobacillus ozensis]KRM67614.1 hypothetical protein FD06_GL000766 [Apilactobacillus ozensis DSM 23829 = JCM 17196]MCK8607255.1 helix-turn-helix transcriptional regulator [Apilactobacillus ozensis]
MNEIGKKLKEMRVGKNIDIDTVAKATNISAKTILKNEQGYYTPELRLVFQLSRYYQASLIDIYGANVLKKKLNTAFWVYLIAFLFFNFILLTLDVFDICCFAIAFVSSLNAILLNMHIRKEYKIPNPIQHYLGNLFNICIYALLGLLLMFSIIYVFYNYLMIHPYLTIILTILFIAVVIFDLNMYYRKVASD